MDEHQHVPDINQLSILSASILLAYALTPFVKLQESEFIIRLPFVVFYYSLSFNTIVSIFVAAMAAVGAIWLVKKHPHFRGNPLRHSPLPALTAWVIGVPLSNLALSPQWWGVFSLGGILLLLVFIAEYIVADFSDVRHSLATIGLSALAFAFFLILTISGRALGLRLYLLLPIIVLTVLLVVVRTLYLRLNGKWFWAWGIGIALVIAQLAIGLQYWPVSPLSYGLILLGPAYALTNIASAIEEGRSFPGFLLEPVGMLAIIWILAILVRG